MKKLLVGLFLVLCVSFVKADPIAYPGSFWGYGTTPGTLVPGAPQNDISYSAKIEQGVDWFFIDEDKKWRYNTFVNTYITKDTSNYYYNYSNQITPAVGTKVRRSFDGGIIDIGVQYAHQYNMATSQSGNGVQAFASYYFGWDLKK